MQFEWDDIKNKSNIRKHGVSFEYATGVFFDEYRIERVDAVLFVVFTERKDNIRLISARLATNEEINEYYKENDIRRS